MSRKISIDIKRGGKSMKIYNRAFMVTTILIIFSILNISCATVDTYINELNKKEHKTLDEYGRQRLDSAVELGEIGDKKAIPHLQAVLQEKGQLQLKLYARASLYRLGVDKEQQLDTIKSYLDPEKNDWLVKMSAVRALGQTKDPVVIPTIVNAVKLDDSVHGEALMSLVKIGTQDAKDGIYEIVNDTEFWPDKNYGVKVMFQVNDPRAIRINEDILLNHSKWLMRREAADRIAQHEIRESIPALKNALEKDEDLSVRAHCYTTLRKFGVAVKVDESYRIIR